MSDDNLSLKFKEETKKSLYKNQNRFTNEKYLLAAIAVNVFIYLLSYFYPAYFTSDAEMFGYILFLLGLIGSFIAFEAFKLAGKFSVNRGETEETVIEPEIMSGYNYISNQNKNWVKWLISAAFGGLNVILYLLFLKFI
jgi:hypothetical protein